MSEQSPSDPYSRAAEVFLRAVDRPEYEREDLLRESCAGDPALRARVDELLAHDEGGTLIEGEEHDVIDGFEIPETLSGSVVMRYRIDERIGEGGMSVVYRAEDIALQRPVALKFLSPGLLHSAEARERFLREARTAAAIDHPNVCPVYEISADRERPFIAMAFLEGQTVADRLRSGPMDVGAAVEVATQACRGLAAAHAKGIVHRDIKPSNLMLVRPVTGTSLELVKILDFGIASYDREHTLTQPGASLGTVSYMSPEQVASEKVDERTDLWSLGVTLYEMLAGRPAFQRATLRELAAAIAGAQPPALDSIRDDAPPGLLRVLDKLLQKDPSDRYASAAETVAALETANLDDQPVTDEPRSGVRSRKLAASWAVAGILVAAIAAYGSWIYSENRLPKRTEALVPQALTSYPGQEAYPMLSPDGKSLAFTWTGPEGKGSDVYVQPIGTYEPIQLTNQLHRDESPVWSPDGALIAFLRNFGGYQEVRLVPSSGGPETLLTTVRGAVTSPALDWSPSGDLLAVATQNGVIGIRVADPDRPPIRYSLRGNVGRYPRFDPSGERLAFVVDNLDGPDEFRVVPVNGDNSAAVRLSSPEMLAHAPAFQFAWSADGKRLIYSGYGEEPFRSIDIANGSLEVLPMPNRIARAPRIRGNELVYYSLVEWTTNVWAVDLDSETARDGTLQARPLIQSSRRQYSPRFSSDSSSIVFTSDRSGSREIWTCDRDGGAVKKLTSSGTRQVGSPVFSPDGSEVAFDGLIEDDAGDIYVLNREGGKPRRLTQSHADDILPSWSADGRWIYFASNRGGGYDVWKIPSEGGKPERVTTGGGWEPILSSDDQYLYYVDPSPSHVVIQRNLNNNEEVAFPELGDAGRYRFWFPTKKGIYFLDSATAPHWIQFLDFETHSTRKTCPFGEREGGPRGLSVSPDGRTLLYAQRDQYNEDIMLVEGIY